MSISDVDRSRLTEVMCVYELKPQVPPAAGATLGAIFDYGRFNGHVRASARLLPRVAVLVDLAPGALGHTGETVLPRFQAVQCLALVTPRNDPLLVVSMMLTQASSHADGIAELLATTCFDRDGLTVSGAPVLDWLAGEAGWSAVSFGRNVHQCVFAGGRLADELLASPETAAPAPAVTSMVYRGTVSADRGARLGVRIPPALNNPGETLLAHARGVSVAAGWSRHVQRAFALAAITMVSAIGVLHRSREAAFDALELNRSARIASTEDARHLISHLSALLNEIQLDLSFGVEAYTDSVLLPELLIDSFQSSLRHAVGLQEGLINTSRMVDRLSSVIRARAAMLEAAAQDEQERRGRVLNIVIAVGSLIALPPSLLLAFFGVVSTDVDPSRSIVDLGHYWLAYALAWLPFAALLIIAFWLRRRIRSKPRLAGFDNHGGEGFATRGVPQPRAGTGVAAADQQEVLA